MPCRPGQWARTELYRERLVRALAHELRVPVLVLDSSVLVPYDYGDGYSESEEEDAESEDEVSESEIEDEGEDEWTRSSESKSGESDDDIDEDGLKSVEELKKSADDPRKLVPCTIEKFAKRIAGAEEGTTSESSESPESSEEEKKAYQRGDRVKYVGSPAAFEADQR
ncbi:hypothetical protein ABZP36_023448 [Zizania latifolia]